MKTWKRGFLVAMSILVAGIASLLAETKAKEPGPFDKFFRSVKRWFTEPQPQRKSSAHHSSHKQTQSTGKPSASPEASPQTSNPLGNNNPPNEKNTRSTSRASTRKGEDLPYGTPVPGK